VTEYVLRDLLNLAMDNPDNHGRNMALQKDIDGTVRLSPLFDFCPMKIDPTGIRRSTEWGCIARPGAEPRI
jgi:serine/threonine-protein kinase HipA